MILVAGHGSRPQEPHQEMRSLQEVLGRSTCGPIKAPDVQRARRVVACGFHIHQRDRPSL